MADVADGLAVQWPAPAHNDAVLIEEIQRLLRFQSHPVHAALRHAHVAHVFLVRFAVIGEKLLRRLCRAASRPIRATRYR